MQLNELCDKEHNRTIRLLHSLRIIMLRKSGITANPYTVLFQYIVYGISSKPLNDMLKTY